MPPPDRYNQDFYRLQAPGSGRSAEVVLPLLTDWLHPSSVVDIGCGIGTWLSVAKKNGAREVLGIDAQHARAGGLLIDDDEFVIADLQSRVEVPSRRFDLAISLEVAEHLPFQRSDSFVSDLTALADVVLFSAGIPGQDGTGHINLQPQSAWRERFDKVGYEAVDLVRPAVWDDERVDSWYRQNTFVMINRQRDDLLDIALERQRALVLPVDLVHPALLAVIRRNAERPASVVTAFTAFLGAGRRALRNRFGRQG